MPSSIQETLDVWLAFNSMLSIVWFFMLAYHMVIVAGRGDDKNELKSLIVVQYATEFIALMFVSMGVTSMLCGYMPSLVNLLSTLKAAT